jgi:hypothetical protein
MRKVTSLAAAALIAAAALATPTDAEARGGRNAPAIIGGLAVGAILGGALSAAQGSYYQPRYYDEPTYYGYPRASGYDYYYFRQPHPYRRYYGYD